MNLHARNDTSRRGIAIGIAFFAVLTALFVVLLRVGPLVQRDTATYLNDASIVPPVYPFFLRLHKWIAGDSFLWSVVAVQLLLGFAASWWLAVSLQRNFSLARYVPALLTLILLLPYFLATHFGNLVLSEGLAYPLFLVMMKYLLEGLVRQRTSALVQSLLWSIVLVLTRRQFYVFYPVFAVMLLYIHVVAPRAFGRLALLVAFVLTITAVQVAEKSVQYARDGHFTPPPFTGFSILPMALFVSNVEDARLFESEEKRTIFMHVYQQLQEKHLLQDTPSEGEPFVVSQIIDRYHASYNAIGWGTFLPVARERGITDWYRMDALARDMSWTLVRHNARRYVKLYCLNAVRGAGGNWQAGLLVLFMLIAAVYHATNRDALSLAAALASVFSIGSLLAIALTQPVIDRYVAYSAGIQLCFYVIVTMECFRGRLREGEPA